VDKNDLKTDVSYRR